MSNKEEKYVNNKEYTAEFRKKTVKCTLIVIIITAAIPIIMIILGLKTDFLYQTDFFKAKADKTVPIHAEKNMYCGSEYEFSIEEFHVKKGVLSVTLNAKADGNTLNLLNKESFKLICYDHDGDEREEIISADIAEKEITDISSEVKGCLFKLNFTKYIDESDFQSIFCLRISTDSSDGIISILCNYNN